MEEEPKDVGTDEEVKALLEELETEVRRARTLTPMQQVLVAMADVSFPLPSRGGQAHEYATDNELVRGHYPPDDDIFPITKINEGHGPYGIVPTSTPPKRQKFWNPKSEKTHKELKAKRRAEKAARRKNRR